MVMKSKLTFVVPDDLQRDLKEKVIKDGYGMRGKSRWISEAVERLLDIRDYPELVNISDEMHGFEKTETVVINYALKIKLDDAILQIRKDYPILEGVKSRILRTSIMQRLLRS